LITGKCKNIRDIRGGKESRDPVRTVSVIITQLQTDFRETYLLVTENGQWSERKMFPDRRSQDLFRDI
jgi:hypothetical protein